MRKKALLIVLAAVLCAALISGLFLAPALRMQNASAEQTGTPALPGPTDTYAFTYPVPQNTPFIRAYQEEVQMFAGETVRLDGLFLCGGVEPEYDVSGGCLIIAGDTVSAAEPGTAKITARAGEYAAAVTVTVSRAAVEFGSRFISLCTGQTAKLEYTVKPAGADVVLRTDGEAAEISGSTVTGVRQGVVRAEAYINGERAGYCFVIVSDRAHYEPLCSIETPRFYASGNALTNGKTGDSAVIMLTGDIMCLSAQQNAAKAGQSFDFAPSFELVRDYFSGADFVMGNLETALAPSHPYTFEAKNIDSLPNCNAPAVLLDALRYAGYDAVAAANNHALDAGEQGIYETLERLEKYRIAVTGIYADEPRYILADINGIRVAFLSYTEIMNRRSAVSAQRYEEFIGGYSAENVKRDCAAARADGAEFIIAYMHWGRENTHEVTDRQKRQAQELADAGVDMIAGSHPHCLQGAQYIAARDGRQVLCVYSMGNFVSSMGRDINNDTVIVRLELTRGESGVTLAGAGYLPCRVRAYNGKRFVITPCGFEDDSGLEAARTRISGVIGEALSELSFSR